MKNQKVYLAVCAALAAILGLAGCDSQESPQAVAQTAGNAIRNNDLTLLRKTLADTALVRYGTQKGLSELSQVMSPYDKFAYSDPEYLGGKYFNDRKAVYASQLRYYRLGIYGYRGSGSNVTGVLLYTANVTCRVDYYQSRCRVGDLDCRTYDEWFCQITDLAR